MENKLKCIFRDLIGHDTGLKSVVSIAKKAAQSDFPCLITGETGTGKEVVAKIIHKAGPRADHPFITVNCGAIPSELVESILFGHEKGSFTGAHEKTLGKFREAQNGTIFLDEIGELPMAAQVKLLRVLQQKEVEPVGLAAAVPINVRVVSATNRNLKGEVQSGRFREDLYFRLNVLLIDIPPLRDRCSDIPALILHFIAKHAAEHGGGLKEISALALNELTRYGWPGNIRQLENAVNRAIVISDDLYLEITDFAEFSDFHDPFEGDTVQNLDMLYEEGEETILRLTRGPDDFKTMGEIEKEAIQAALEYYNKNVTKASRALGLAKSTFYRKLKAYDIFW